MTHSEFQRSIHALNETQMAFEQARREVWRAFVSAEPALDAEVLNLFASEEAATQWLCTRTGVDGLSPAKRVAEGRAAEVVAQLQRAAHGFVA